jgi:predicted transcriptional regulator
LDFVFGFGFFSIFFGFGFLDFFGVLGFPYNSNPKTHFFWGSNLWGFSDCLIIFQVKKLSKIQTKANVLILFILFKSREDKLMKLIILIFCLILGLVTCDTNQVVPSVNQIAHILNVIQNNEQLPIETRLMYAANINKIILKKNEALAQMNQKAILRKRKEEEEAKMKMDSLVKMIQKIRLIKKVRSKPITYLRF